MDLVPQMKVKRMNLCWKSKFKFLHPLLGCTIPQRFSRQRSGRLHRSGRWILMVHLKRCHLWWKVALLCRYGDLIVHCQAAQLPLACIWVLLLPAYIWWLLLCCSTFTALVRCQRPSRCADATIILGAAAVAGHLLTVTGLTLKEHPCQDK